MPVETYTFADDGQIPNSSLPVLVYHDVEGATDASTCEQLFARNRWLGAWRDGIFSFHHFHSTAHEVLGIVAGSAANLALAPPGDSRSPRHVHTIAPGGALVELWNG